MKNKGFTLVELLAVIVILGLIGTIGTVSYNASYKRSLQANCNRFVEKIENAACTAVATEKEVDCNKETGCEVLVNHLILAGYIDKEENACKSDEDYRKNYVSVNWVDGEKKCVYNGTKTYTKAEEVDFIEDLPIEQYPIYNDFSR